MLHRRFLPLGCLAAALALGGAPAGSDAKGESTLKAAFKALHAAKGLTATITQTVNAAGQPAQTLQGTVAALKPNLLKVELKGPQSMLYVCDGKNYYSYQSRRNQYTKTPAEAAPKAFLGQWEGEIDGFFGGEGNVALATVTHMGTEKVEGADCDLVKAEPKPGTLGVPVTYAVNQKDHRILRATLAFMGGGQMVTQTNVLSEVKINPPLKATDFKFTPPAGSKEAPAQ